MPTKKSAKPTKSTKPTAPAEGPTVEETPASLNPEASAPRSNLAGVVLRIGAFKNMQDPGTPFTPTAGLGLRIFAFRLDLGGGYDFREKGALASGSVSMTF